MAIKIAKGHAFLLSLGAIFIMFITTSTIAAVSWFRLSPEFRRTELLLPFIGTFVTAIVSLAAGFFGFNVADNGVKGKFFNQGLSDKKE